VNASKVTLNKRNPNHEFIKTFVWRDLAKTLSELGCGDFELASMANWFWNESQLWSDKKTQAAFNETARDRLQQHVADVHGFNDAIATKLKPKPNPPLSEDEPPPVWRPCRHYDRDSLREMECPRCGLKPKLLGPMARAQALYEDHRGHVLDRLHGELLTYTDGRNPRDNAPFDDLENEVWQRVAKRVESFATSPDLASGGVLAWLSTIVHSVVRQHYKGIFRHKRDVRKETVLPDDPKAWVTASYAEPVQPTGVGPDRDRDRDD
jgi:hypothetical protein